MTPLTALAPYAETARSGGRGGPPCAINALLSTPCCHLVTPLTALTPYPCQAVGYVHEATCLPYAINPVLSFPCCYLVNPLTALTHHAETALWSGRRGWCFRSSAELEDMNPSALKPSRPPRGRPGSCCYSCSSCWSRSRRMPRGIRHQHPAQSALSSVSERTSRQPPPSTAEGPEAVEEPVPSHCATAGQHGRLSASGLHAAQTENESSVRGCRPHRPP